MRPTRTLTLGLIALLALAGAASATGSGVSVTTGHGSASAESLVDQDHRYADGDAAATTGEAAGALDTDASASDATAAKDDGFFGWLQLGWTAVAAKVESALAKLGLEADLDGSAEAYVSDDGVDVDADVLGHDLDGSPAGKLDDKTWDTISKVKEVAPQIG